MPSASLMSAWASIAQKHSSRFKDCASLIIPRLYLSGLSTAMDDELISKLGVTHVVSVLDWAPEFPASIPVPNRLHINLSDYSTSNILAHLDTTTEFVKAALEENESNVVLVSYTLYPQVIYSDNQACRFIAFKVSAAVRL